MEWISVKDEPIPEQKNVLAGLWVNDRESDDFYFERDVIYIDGGDVGNVQGESTGWPIEEYTHWMPLPPPPTKQDDR